MTGAEFKAIRLKLQLTQKELAEILHLNVMSISRMENGHYKILYSHAYRMQDLLLQYTKMLI